MIGVIYFIGSLIIQHNEQKRIDEITQAMEESAQIEKLFANNQQKLSNTELEELKLYNQLTSYQVDHNKDIKKTAEEALSSIEKQQKHLEKSKENFSKAYEMIASIQPISKKVRDKKQAKSILSLEKINEERYQLYLTYSEDYNSLFALNKNLYQQLEKQDFNEKALDEQIKEINQLYKKLHSQEKQFNQYTTQFNNEKKHYYQLINRI